MKNISIIYASTSGHTEFVVERVAAVLREQMPGCSLKLLRAEKAQPHDLKGQDLLIFASGTWNTGGVEGQLNPHMHELLFSTLKGLHFAGQPMAFISLGDDRYYFTTRCTEHFQKFRMAVQGKQAVPPLIIVNEPYGQESKIDAWAKRICTHST